jgi:DNA-binding MarR family transcriptional regulator
MKRKASGLPDLHGAAALVRRSVAGLARRLRSEGAQHGISLSKLSAMAHLYHAKEMTAVGLAAAERIQPQSLTRMLSELESDGLIARRPHEVDRRSSVITLTRQGAEILLSDVHRRESWLADAMRKALTPDEIEILLRATELMDRLSSTRDPADEPVPPATRVSTSRAKPRARRLKK